MDVKRFGSRRSTHTFSSISVLCCSSYGAVFTNLASLQSNVTAVFAHEPCLQPHIPPGSCVRLRLLCGKNEGTPPNLYVRFCQYSPTSPAYSPTSPAYSPTSPQVSSLVCAFVLSMWVLKLIRLHHSIHLRRRTRIDLVFYTNGDNNKETSFVFISLHWFSCDRDLHLHSPRTSWNGVASNLTASLGLADFCVDPGLLQALLLINFISRNRTYAR